MNKQRTLVCLVSQQTVPNYLFIKEMYQPGDELWLITSKGGNEVYVKYLQEVLGWTNATIKVLTLAKEHDEEDWNRLIKQFDGWFSDDRQYVVSVIGGTKPMNLALYEALRTKDSTIYYIPYGRNDICQMGRGAKVVPITYRLSVDEYVRLYGHRIYNSSACIRSLADNERIFQAVLDGYGKEVAEGLSMLRKLRGKKSDLSDDPRLRAMRNSLDKKSCTGLSIDELPEAQAVMKQFGFIPEQEGFISKKEIEYLTGGWFEEWAMQQVKSHLNLSDGHILANAHLDEANGNELDVVFTHENKLYVIECKSGIDRLSEFKNYVTKVSAIRNNLKGLSATSAIFGISSDDQSWSEAARYFGINYVSRSMLADPTSRFSFIK